MAEFDSAWRGGGERRLFATFTGSGSEYFRVWIVNTLLTILTLGIYLAWAKVRKRRYFYWNTYLDGHRFDYLAEPKSIFIGHVAVAAALLLTRLTEGLNATVGMGATLIIYSLIPWLVYKAHRFRARNSAYRGIRFRFLGTVLDAYKVYGILPGIFLLAAGAAFLSTMVGGGKPSEMLLGISSASLFLVGVALYPAWMYLRRRYTFSNMAFGGEMATFRPRMNFFYKVYLKAFGLGCAGLAAAFVASALLFGAAAAMPTIADFSFTTFLGVTFIFSGVYFLVEQYAFANLTNHCWNNLKLGDISFKVDLDPWKLLVIRVTNAGAILLSLGFMAPWAEARRYGYIASRFSVIAPEGLDHVTSAADSDVAAYGDAAADVFDLDVGW